MTMGTWARTLPQVPTVPSYGSSYTYDPHRNFTVNGSREHRKGDSFTTTHLYQLYPVLLTDISTSPYPNGEAGWWSTVIHNANDGRKFLQITHPSIE